MIIAIGGCARAGKRPKQGKPVINNIEGFGFISEDMLSTRDGLIFVVFLRIRIGAGLVGAGIVDIGSLRITPGGKATVFAAGGLVAGATVFASGSRGTRPFWARF